MRILHILNSTSGGSAESTFDLTTELARNGVASALVCADNGSAELKARIAALFEGRALFLPLYWTNKKIRAKPWKRPLLEVYHLHRTWGGYKHQKLIQKFILDHQIDLIHTSTILNPEGAIAAKALGLPHLWHVRELLGPDKHFQFYNYRNWAARVLKDSRKLIANSEATRQCLLPFFPEEHIEKIPNAIRVGDFQIKTHREKRPVVVGMVGNVTSRLKNHRFFIEVAAALKDHPEIRFEIFGKLPPAGDPYFSGLKRLSSSLGLTEDRLVFRGFGSPPEIMQAIDILFHPTELESFGRIFTEAMAAGLPVIGRDEGGATEMIRHGENGFLFDKARGQVEDYILRLTADPALRQEMGLAGRRIAESDYDLPILAGRMIRLYEQILKKQTTWIS